MKKALFFVSLMVLSFSSLDAQIARDKVVVECGTGTWCTYCPGAAMGIDDLILNGWPVAAIENHNGDAFANVYSNARNNYYNITGFPTTYFDGLNPYIGGSNTQSMYSNYWPRVQSRMDVPSPVDIEVWGTHTNQDYDVTVRLQKMGTISGSDIRLHTVVTESEIFAVWFGLDHVNYVNRLMAPDQNGTQLDFSATDVIEVPLSFSLQPGWSLVHLELVVFVQNNTSKEILQGYKVKLAFLMPPPPPLAASFYADDTVTCQGSEVQFHDNSTGNVVEWLWLFPGGTPDTSRDENPQVTYGIPGKYNVSLTVSDGIGDSTIVLNDYINVYELPEVTFGPVDDQCISNPPFILDQGSPEGGIYSGPGVDEEGYFHPDQAGSGTHTLTYTYTDGNGCSNNSETEVMVDACTGIDEASPLRIATMPNPTNGKFRLMLTGNEEQVKLSIANSIGRIVMQENNVRVNGASSTEIDLTGFSAGIYFLRIEYGQSTCFRKIILK